MPEKVKYEELTPIEFKRRLAAAPVAYLPLGTLEWHGEHLPLGADGLQSQGFFELLARRTGGIVLPMVFLGPDQAAEIDGKELYGMDIFVPTRPEKPAYPSQQLPGSAYWLPEETFGLILQAILKQLSRAGFKVVVAHGHGPSTRYFSEHSPEWERAFDLRLFTCWDSRPETRELGLQIDHAAKNETSLTMALRPELVHMENLSSDPAEKPLAVSGEDPRYTASPEWGRQVIAAQLERMEALIMTTLESGGTE